MTERLSISSIVTPEITKAYFTTGGDGAKDACPDFLRGRYPMHGLPERGTAFGKLTVIPDHDVRGLLRALTETEQNG
jgi:hypothetical protein